MLPHPATGLPLLRHQLNLLRSLGPASLLLSVRNGREYPGFFPDLPRVGDDGDAGPLGAIEAALTACPTPLLLVVAVDLPCLRSDYLHALLAVCDVGRGSVPQHPGTPGLFEPLCAVYPNHAPFLAALHAARQAGRLSLQQILAEAVAKDWIRPVPVAARDRACFINWNSPADFGVSPDEKLV